MIERTWSANFFGHLQMLTVFSLMVLQWCSNQEVFRTPSLAAYIHFGCSRVPISSCYKTLDRGTDPERMNQGIYQLCARMTIPLLYKEFHHFNSAAYNTIVATLRHVRSIQNFQTVKVCLMIFEQKLKIEFLVCGHIFSVLWLKSRLTTCLLNHAPAFRRKTLL